MLKYLYTASIPDDADVVEVFALAHRFDVRGLIADAGEKMLKGWTQENVKDRAKALVLHKDSPDAGEVWDKMCEMLIYPLDMCM